MGDELDVRVALEEAVQVALRVGDELAQAAAARDLSDRLGELAARYLAARGEVRRLRRALTVEVAG